MIKHFELGNIKSFSSVKGADFAPITLIYGPNSSGKSSIIQAILLLKQSLFSKSFDYNLVQNGKFVSLGALRNLVHKHDLTRSVDLNIDFVQRYDAAEYLYKNNRRLPIANSSIRYTEFRYAPEVNDKISHLQLEQFNYVLPDKKIDFSVQKFGKAESLRYRLTNIGDDTVKYFNQESKIGDTSDHLKMSLTHSESLNFPCRITGERADSISSVLSIFFDDLKELLLKIKYLGPLRSAPRRIYLTESSGEAQSSGKSNLGIDLHNAGAKIVQDINVSLKDFNIPYEVKVDNIGSDQSGEAITVNLKDLRSGATVTPVDVGFGIGQVLPIILESIISREKIICVEQPEIHLHPKLQANLADLFIESTKRGNQWVIETHSEALMLRLQKRVKDKSISKELISILYVDIGVDGASIINIPLDEDGNFTIHWPGGFFEERLDEMYGD